MKGYKSRPTRFGRRRLWVGVSLTLVGVLTLLFWFGGRVAPLLQRLAQNRAESITQKLIHDEVGGWLADQTLTYDSLVSFGYAPSGEMVYVGTDMVKLNTLKASIGSRIQQRFDQYDFGSISLPIGTLLGGELLLGRGPALRFRVDMSCSVQCTFANVFDDAGINQTRHQILLEVTGTTYAVAKWCKTSSKVTTNFIVAETVLMGEVPDYYTSVEHSDDVVQDLNDYGYDMN